MKNIIILMGHGNYATGLKSTIGLVVGPTKGISYIDFLEEDSSDSLMEKALDLVNENVDNNIVFACDILGGTPFNTAVKLSLENNNIRVVAGCNIGAIIEAVMIKDTMNLDELADELVNKTISSVCKYESKEIEIEDYTCEDGI